jgi:hypothetical protein
MQTNEQTPETNQERVYIDIPMHFARIYYGPQITYNIESRGERDGEHEYYRQGAYSRALERKLDEDRDYYGVTLGGGYGLVAKLLANALANCA